MKFTYLGTGSAFSVQNWQSNMFVEINGRRLLVDAGGYLPLMLHAQGLSSLDFHAVYLSHKHADHIGGVESLALSTKFNPKFVDESGKKRKLQLYLGYDMADDLWTHALEAGCATIEGEVNTLSTYFDVHECPKNGSFTFEGVDFQLIQVLHYVNNAAFAPSYGLFWKAPDGRKVFHTTDTQFAPHSIFAFYRQADLILHDCETTQFQSGVHAHYKQLLTLPPEVRARMILHHYADGEKPDCVQDGFLGWATPGQTIDLSAK